MLVNVIIIRIESTVPSGTTNLTDTTITTNLNELITYSIEGDERNGQQTTNKSVRQEYFPYLCRKKTVTFYQRMH